VYFMMHRFQSLRPYTPPSEVLDIFRRELDAAYDEGGIFQLTMHPHIIGYRSRIWILEEIIRHAPRKAGTWFATHARVGEWVNREGGGGVGEGGSRVRRSPPRGPDVAHGFPYSSWRRHQMPVSLRPLGARSSHWYMPQRPSTPRAYAE